MMMYICAEREADWCLDLTAPKGMLPYFFATWHVNYARYGLDYLRSIEAMPKRRSCHASCPRALEWNLERYIEALLE